MSGTYPKPSSPALLHKDTTLHGAPTVEDTPSCGADSSLRNKAAMEKGTDRSKIRLAVGQGRVKILYNPPSFYPQID